MATRASKTKSTRAPRGAAKLRCAAPGCSKSFSPPAFTSRRQRYCSNACRQRAFYWEFKRRHRVRYAARPKPVKPRRRRTAARKRPR